VILIVAPFDVRRTAPPPTKLFSDTPIPGFVRMLRRPN
jgi:hypothetical protein